MVLLLFASAFLGLGIALIYYIKVSSIPITQGIENTEEAEKLTKIHGAIARGAMAFLKAEYKILSIFVILTSILLAWETLKVHSIETFMKIGLMINILNFYIQKKKLFYIFTKNQHIIQKINKSYEKNLSIIICYFFFLF